MTDDEDESDKHLEARDCRQKLKDFEIKFDF